MVMEDTLLSRAPSSPRLSLSSGRHSSVGISVAPHGNEVITAVNTLGVPSDASAGAVNLMHVASSPNLSSPFSGHSLQKLATIEYPSPRSLSLTNSSSQAVDLNIIRNVHTKESDNPSLVRLRSLPLDDYDNRNVSNTPNQHRSLPGTPLAAPKGGMTLSNVKINQDIPLQFQLSIDNPRAEHKTSLDEDAVSSKMETEENNKTLENLVSDQIQGCDNEDEEKSQEDSQTEESIKTETNMTDNFIKIESTPIEIIVKQSSVEITENMDDDAISLVVDSSCEENPPPITRTESSSSADVADNDNKFNETKEHSSDCGGEEGEDDDERKEHTVNAKKPPKIKKFHLWSQTYSFDRSRRRCIAKRWSPN
jgi:hypothetical protein